MKRINLILPIVGLTAVASPIALSSCDSKAEFKVKLTGEGSADHKIVPEWGTSWKIGQDFHGRILQTTGSMTFVVDVDYIKIGDKQDIGFSYDVWEYKLFISSQYITGETIEICLKPASISY